MSDCDCDYHKKLKEFGPQLDSPKSNSADEHRGAILVELMNDGYKAREEIYTLKLQQRVGIKGKEGLTLMHFGNNHTPQFEVLPPKKPLEIAWIKTIEGEDHK